MVMVPRRHHEELHVKKGGEEGDKGDKEERRNGKAPPRIEECP